MANQTAVQDERRPIEAARALVLVSPRQILDSDRPEASFLAQLIACDRRLPAYRNVRRADPVAAASAYQLDMPHHAAIFQRVI